ncbi:hypothetical protein [Pseudarthrobacter phenanthrenivorans]|uniref:hypothetical protein n=1 Tax=Pseudarthrobacter phenanthrenivorans TaxID=361575 RepID=UPI002F351214
MNNDALTVVLTMLSLNVAYLIIAQTVLAISYVARAVARKVRPHSRLATRAGLRYMILVPAKVAMPISRKDEWRLVDSLSIAGKVNVELLLILPLANTLSVAAVFLLSRTAFSSLLNAFATYVVIETLAFMLFSPVLMHMRYRLTPIDSIGEAARYLSLSAQKYRRSESYWAKQAYATNLRRFLYVASKCGVQNSNRYVGNLIRTAQNDKRTAAEVHRNIGDVFQIASGIYSGDYVWSRTSKGWSLQNGHWGSTALKVLALVPGLALIWQVVLGIMTLTRG